MEILHCYWHLQVTNGNFTLLLISSGQEWQFHTATICWQFSGHVKNGNFTLHWHLVVWHQHISTDILSCRMAISHCYWHTSGQFSHYYWHLVVKNGNFTLLLTSTGQEWQFHCYWCLVSRMAILHVLLTSSSQEWQFHIATDTTIVVKNGNFALLLVYSGQDWQFHTANWHLQVKNGNFTLLLISSGQEWQFHTTNDTHRSRMAISHCYWHLQVKNGNFTLLLTSSGQ